MPFENTKMSAARYEDYKFPPNIICHPNTSYARDPCDFLKKGPKFYSPAMGFFQKDTLASPRLRMLFKVRKCFYLVDYYLEKCKPRPHVLESRP